MFWIPCLILAALLLGHGMTYKNEQQFWQARLIMTTPFIILIEPQLGENIGMVARAMANMGLSRLRLVNPRDGWPNDKAIAASSGAHAILEKAELFENAASAVGDCHYIVAASARVHRQAKPVCGPQEAAQKIKARLKAGQSAALLFGRERNGLEKDEISLAHEILTFPVAEDFPSLNLAQAVLLTGYALRMADEGEGELLPHVTELGSKPATSEETEGLMAHLAGALEQKGYFNPDARAATMKRNLRNIFLRQSLTAQDVQTLHGVIGALDKN